MNLSFKYGTTDGKILEYPIDDDEALEAMSEHLKSTLIPSLKLYVEKEPLKNENVHTLKTQQDMKLTFYIPSPTPMPQKSQNPFVPSSSCTRLNPLKRNLYVT